MIELDFEKTGGLIPAVIQDAKTMRVLMLGFMNEAAFSRTVTEKRVTFFSRTKKRLWTKGESSGNFLNVVEIKKDCDSDTLLILVSPVGPVCHTGSDTCFNEANSGSFLEELSKIIRERHVSPSDKSYTSSLFSEGLNRIAQKVGEEAVEVVIASKDGNSEPLVEESADLLFHLMVLLELKGLTLRDIESCLEKRHKKGR